MTDLITQRSLACREVRPKTRRLQEFQPQSCRRLSSLRCSRQGLEHLARWRLARWQPSPDACALPSVRELRNIPFPTSRELLRSLASIRWLPSRNPLGTCRFT